MGNQSWKIIKDNFSKAHSENRHIKQAMAQVSGFANTAVYKANNGYHRETTAEIKILVEVLKSTVV